MTQHFQVRAFAGWPGTRARVQVVDAANAQENILDLKIITTKVSRTCHTQNAEPDYVAFRKGALIFCCGGDTALEVRFLILHPFSSSNDGTMPLIFERYLQTCSVVLFNAGI